MRVTLLWILLIVVCAATSLAQFTGSTIDGSNLVYDHASTSTAKTDATVAYVDVWPYWNALTTSHDICKAIFNAISAFGTAAPQTITLDARGITGKQVCTINPFATTVSLQAFTGKLLLGQVLIETNVQWTLPNQYFWIEGTVMSNGTASVGSTIQASNGGDLNMSKFNCSPTGSLQISNSIVTGCPVVFISGPGCSGNPTCTAYVSEGTGIRDLAIDCNSLDGTVTGTSPCIGAGAYELKKGVELIPLHSSTRRLPVSRLTPNLP
jgi:hypothetical protein